MKFGRFAIFIINLQESMTDHDGTRFQLNDLDYLVTIHIFRSMFCPITKREIKRELDISNSSVNVTKFHDVVVFLKVAHKPTFSSREKPLKYVFSIRIRFVHFNF